MITFYGRHSNMLVSRPLNFQNKIICFLFSAKHFWVGTGGADFHWPNQLETEVWSRCKAYYVRKQIFLTKELRGLETILLLWQHKNLAMFIWLVVCIHMRNFKWFRSILIKIYMIFQFVRMLCNITQFSLHRHFNAVV